MRLYLARHGESEANVKLLLYGRTDCPLTDKGREDARLLGEKLRDVRIRRCYSSPLSRAAETARIALSGRDVEIEHMDGLMEQDMGELENTSFVEMSEKYAETIRAMLLDWTSCVPPGGESYQQIQARLYPCLDAIIDRGEDALIVAHNGPLCALMARLLDTSPKGIDKFWFKHGCFSCIDIKDGRIRLEYFNL